MGEALERWAMEHVDPGETEERQELRLRERSKIEEDRTRTMRWYLSNVSIGEIATRLESNVRTVQRDIAAVRREWERQRVVDYNLEMAKQLSRIDTLEAEAWDAWYATKGEIKKTRGETRTVMTRSGPQQIQSGVVETKQGAGDPAYMIQIRWCIEERSRLLGLYAPRKLAVAVSPNDGNEDGSDNDSDAARLLALAQRFKQSQLGAGGATDAPATDERVRATVLPSES